MSVPTDKPLRDDDLPPRLIDGIGDSADLLRRFVHQPAVVPSDARSWHGVLARLAATPRTRSGMWMGVAGLVVGVAAMGALLARFEHGTNPAAKLARAIPSTTRSIPQSASPPPAAAPVVRAAPPVRLVDGQHVAGAAAFDRRGAGARSPRTIGPHSTSQDVRRFALGPTPRALPAGPAELIDEAHVSLSRTGRAQAFIDEAGPAIELVAGSVALHVETQTGGRHFRVLVSPYTFTVLGTRFELERQRDGTVSLVVAEGRVAVSAHGRSLAVIEGGRAWTGTPKGQGPDFEENASGGTPERALAAATPPAMAMATSAPPSAPSTVARPAPIAAVAAPVPCADRIRDDVRGAIACYHQQAAGNGLPAEVALYESAKLRGDVLADPRGALDALAELRRRFPMGALRVDAELSIAELLPRLGRFHEALDASAAFLKERPTNERAADLHLLRGNIYREALHDCAAAEREYGRVEGRGHTADQAGFWRATCLETLGLRAQAKQAYRVYLTRTGAERAPEAASRLRALE